MIWNVELRNYDLKPCNLELWNSETLELWNSGALELWNPKPLKPEPDLQHVAVADTHKIDPAVLFEGFISHIVS